MQLGLVEQLLSFQFDDLALQQHAETGHLTQPLVESVFKTGSRGLSVSLSICWHGKVRERQRGTTLYDAGDARLVQPAIQASRVFCPAI